MSSVEMVELRQQLSSRSLELLQAAMRRDLGKLRQLREDVCGLTRDAAVYAKIDALESEMQLALRQLGYVYLDQFVKGRAENDADGRVGLVNGKAMAIPA